MDAFSFEISSSLTPADVDMEGRLRAGELVNLLIRAASGSADYLGFGFDDIRCQELFWVLHRLTVEIVRPMTWNETIRVESWPKDINGLFYLRDFLVRDHEEKITARATSGWLAVNLKSKRPSLVDSFNLEKLTSLKEKHALMEAPEKLGPVTSGDQKMIHSSWYDYDINRHVTSSRYIDWMMDSLPVGLLMNHYPRRFSVNFMKEILPGETIRLTYLEDRHSHHFQGVKEETGIVAYRGKVQFGE